MCNKSEKIKVLPVKEIFNEDQYIIPIYQRNYAWGVKEIEQLLNDIVDFEINEKSISEESQTNYYLGNLIVDKNDKNTNSYYVIDGQQRLTTLFLLFKHLNIGNLKINSLRFEAREKSNRTLIENFEEILKYNNLDTFSTELIEGYKIIKNYFVSKINDNKNFNEKFFNKLDKIRIIRTQVPDKIDLNHYFEVMNTRGEQLELHEIAKARIIEKLSKKDSIIAAKIWDACSQMDTYVQMNFKPDISRILFSEKCDTFNIKIKCFDDIKLEIINTFENRFTNVFSNYIKKNKLPDESKKIDILKYLESIFDFNWDKLISHEIKKIKPVKENNSRKKTDIIDSLDNSILNTDNSLFYILQNYGNKIINHKKDKNNEDKKERFESIISFPNYLLQVFAATKDEYEIANKDDCKDIVLDDKKLLDTLKVIYDTKDKEKNEQNAKLFIFNLLRYRFLFDKFVIKRDNTKNDWSLKELTKNKDYYYRGTFRKKDENVSEEDTNEYSDEDNNLPSNNQLKLLQATLRITYTSPQNMDWITEILKHFKEKGSDNKVIYKNEIDFETLQSSLENYCKVKITNFYNKCIQTNNDINSIGYPYIPRIVFAYLDYLLFKQERYRVNNIVVDFKNWKCPFRNSIEHFYPQNPINPNEKWEKDKPLDSFGNLALITVSGNSKFSNLSPQSKKDSYPDIIKQSPKLMIMASYCNNNEKWDEGKVIDHGAEMFGILKNGLLSKGTKQSNE